MCVESALIEACYLLPFSQARSLFIVPFISLLAKLVWDDILLGREETARGIAVETPSEKAKQGPLKVQILNENSLVEERVTVRFSTCYYRYMHQERREDNMQNVGKSVNA
jgi:hypothetical protein